MFLYEEVSIDNPFRQYIRKCWTLDNSASSLPTEAKFVLPNTCFTLVFISGLGLNITNQQQRVSLGPGSYLAGQLTARASISLQPYSKATMLQLNAWTACLLTGC